MARRKAHLEWRGDAVLAQLTRRAVAATGEITNRMEAGAKAELYKPRHGVRTGTLRRAITRLPVRVEGSRVIGGLGTGQEVRKYALVQHRRYEYLTRGLKKTIPSVAEILARHMKGRGG
jgi:hypothetical protein